MEAQWSSPPHGFQGRHRNPQAALPVGKKFQRLVCSSAGGSPGPRWSSCLPRAQPKGLTKVRQRTSSMNLVGLLTPSIQELGWLCSNKLNPQLIISLLQLLRWWLGQYRGDLEHFEQCMIYLCFTKLPMKNDCLTNCFHTCDTSKASAPGLMFAFTLCLQML